MKTERMETGKRSRRQLYAVPLLPLQRSLVDNLQYRAIAFDSMEQILGALLRLG